MGFGVWGLGLGAWGLGFRVLGYMLIAKLESTRVKVLGLRV